MVRLGPVVSVLRGGRRMQSVVGPVQPSPFQVHPVHSSPRETGVRGPPYILDLHNNPASHDTCISVRYDRNDEAFTSVPHTPGHRDVRCGHEHENGVQSVEYHRGTGTDQLPIHR